MTKRGHRATWIRILIPILAAALPAFGLAIWLVIQGASEQREQIHERHEARARTIAFALEQVVESQASEVELLAASPILSRPEPAEEIDLYLREFLEVNEGWRDISLTSSDGRIISSTADDVFDLYVGDRDYFEEVMDSGEVVVSRPLIGRGKGEASIIVAAPVDPGSGRRRVLLAVLPLGWLHGAVAEHVPFGSRVQILDADGDVVADPGWTEGDVRPAPEELRAFAASALRGNAGARVTQSEAGEVMTAFAPTQEHEWAVVMSTSAEQAFRYADTRLRTGLGLAALALGGITLLSWRFGGRLAAAMEGLDEARRRAEKARRRAALAADASRELSAHDSYESTIPEVAGLACAELGAWGVVELIDEEGHVRSLCEGPGAQAKRPPSAEPSGARALPPEIADAIRVRRGALQRGRAQLLELSDGGEGEPATALVAPLSVGERLKGWLVFVAPGRGAYGRDELALAEDLGGRAAMAIANAELYRSARESSRAREHVLGVVAHDLRSPLTTIDLSVAALARDEGISPRAERTLERIARASVKMQRLIRDLLDAAHADRSAFRGKAEAHSAAELLRDTAEAYQPIAAEKDVGIEVEPPDERATVWCDRDRIDQVLSNIVTNAIRFTPPGGAVTIAASALAAELAFEVRDSGPGIPPQELPRIFERFWHGTGDAGGNTGLGLAIAKAIVEAHGGRIWAENPPEGGALFVFTLPREGAAGASSEPLGDPRAASAREGTAAGAGGDAATGAGGDAATRAGGDAPAGAGDDPAAPAGKEGAAGGPSDRDGTAA